MGRVTVGFHCSGLFLQNAKMYHFKAGGVISDVPLGDVRWWEQTTQSVCLFKFSTELLAADCKQIFTVIQI